MARQDKTTDKLLTAACGAGGAVVAGAVSGEMEHRKGEDASFMTNVGTAVLGGLAYVLSGEVEQVAEAGKGAFNGSLSLMAHQGVKRARRAQTEAEVKAKQDEQRKLLEEAAARAEAEDDEEEQQDVSPRFQGLEIDQDEEEEQHQHQQVKVSAG